MDQKGPKLTFGFKKVILKPNLLPQNGASIANNSKIEMIDSIEGSAIKISGEELQKKLETKLIIPMSNDQKTTPIEKLIEDRKKIASNRNIKREIKVEPAEPSSDVEMKEIPINETIEQQAARELIEDLQQKIVKSEVKVFEVPVNADDLPLEGAKESSLDDYDRVPINDFGKAMLRGMGWKDEEKDDSKKLDPDGPILRPKGMGLGADKVIKKQPLLVAPSHSETLEIKRHACIKILAGKHKNFYGTIEGFDDGGGRVVVKLAIGGLRVTINEFMVQPIAKQEFAKYGKVLNSEKYEEYKSGDITKTTSSLVSSRKEIDDKNLQRSRSEDRHRKDSRNQSRSRSKDRKHDHKSRDRKSEINRSEQSSSSRKYRGRSRSREKRSRRHSSSSDDIKHKKKSSKYRKEYSSPDSRKSSENDKRHKKKTKKSKHKRDRS